MKMMMLMMKMMMMSLCSYVRVNSMHVVHPACCSIPLMMMMMMMMMSLCRYVRVNSVHVVHPAHCSMIENNNLLRPVSYNVLRATSLTIVDIM